MVLQKSNIIEEIKKLFVPINKPKTRNYQLIIEQFRKMIEQGKLHIEDKLASERILCQQFSVSRTSLREAISALELSGVIERRPEGNFIINTDSFYFEKTLNLLVEGVTASELIEARMAIEKEITSIAAINRTEDNLREIEAILSNLENLIDYKKYWIREDLDFHMAIAKATKNVLLIRIMKVLYAPIKRKLWLSINKEILKNQVLINELKKNHKAIFNAIKNQNFKKAEKAAELHLKKVSENIFSQIRDSKT